MGWLGSVLYCLVALKTDHVNRFALLNMLFSRIEFHLVLAGKTVSMDSCEQLHYKDILVLFSGTVGKVLALTFL